MVGQLVEHDPAQRDLGLSPVLPDTLLSRPDGLSAGDVQLVRRHPELGYEVVRQVPALEPHAGGERAG